MKVLLIRPNSRMATMYMPVGMGYIADAVRKAGHEVSFLDARLLRLPPQKVAAYARDVAPDIIGFSCLHFEKQSLIEVARNIRQVLGPLPLVLGGPLVSTSGIELVDKGIIDVAFIGEGERSFCNYLEAMESGRAVHDLPGIIYLLDTGEVQSNPPGPFIENLDELSVAWDLIDIRKYFGFFSRSSMDILGSGRCGTLFTSRGCPFRCIYCHNIFGKKFRARSPKSVLDEIVMLRREYGIQRIEIVDDIFNLDLERAKEIARGIIDLDFKLAISFPNGLRADRMDEELVDLLKEAGTYRLNYAVETASPRLQKMIRKNVDLEKTSHMISYTADKGIMTLCFFMLGFPTETEEEMNMTVDYALNSKLHGAQFFYVNPHPGTELAEKYYPVPLEGDAVNDMGYFDLKINLSEVPDETLRRIMKSVYRRFYFSPSRMWRLFRIVPKNLRTLWSVVVVTQLSLRDRSVV